ncbi:hypothetical protein [Streptomyces xantholiticus]|uniref:hypothetical protein n=1 Tax=Streptomyces xantholiticus TaxID=68285 RepID=UPI001676B7A6|nr:hypothetical protein [Streptomyces xantholiticus]GGW26370.1 hypothetical protein GCM10010381_08150 [Streptomyces xantholiticus]
MHTPRTAALAALLLLGMTGCVSVPSAPRPAPAPSLVPAGDRLPSPVEPSRALQPPTRGTLASTGPMEQRKAKQETGERAEGGAGGKVRSRPVPRQRPAPARRAAPEPEHQRPRPRPQQPRPPQFRTSHDMRGVCEASEGLTDPNITALCRDTYGSGRN